MLTADDLADVECHIGQRVFGHTGVVAAQDRCDRNYNGSLIPHDCVVFEDPVIHRGWLRHR